MKKQLRKYLSVERRDPWDNPKTYQFWYLSVDRLKHKLKHIPNKDSKMKSKLEEALGWRCHHAISISSPYFKAYHSLNSHSIIAK